MTYLARHDHASVATIAEALGYSHQAVTKAVDQLEGLDLVVSGTSAEDLRVRQVSLTETGHLQIEKLQRMIGQIDAVLEQIFDETGVDLFRALRQFEKALERRSLLDRFIEAESGTESVSDE
ncbi:MAG: MarR family transcriptional regulator [Pseudomonadota bacterium]